MKQFQREPTHNLPEVQRASNRIPTKFQRNSNDMVNQTQPAKETMLMVFLTEVQRQSDRTTNEECNED